MSYQKITLKSEVSKKEINILKVPDICIDAEAESEISTDFWIYEKNSEFFPFELWSILEKTRVGDTLNIFDDNYKVINILD